VSTPAERREWARIAANERWAAHGARETASRVHQAAMRARLIEEVDPEGVMAPEDLEPALLNAAKAMTARMRAAKARQSG